MNVCQQHFINVPGISLDTALWVLVLGSLSRMEFHSVGRCCFSTDDWWFCSYVSAQVLPLKQIMSSATIYQLVIRRVKTILPCGQKTRCRGLHNTGVHPLKYYKSDDICASRHYSIYIDGIDGLKPYYDYLYWTQIEIDGWAPTNGPKTALSWCIYLFLCILSTWA